jgi:hypothetical protein
MRLHARLLLFGAVVALFAALSAVAVASSPHFKRGGSPTCIVSTSGSSSSTTCSASLAGLGQETLVINVTVSGFAVYQCQNPSEQNEPRGQNKVLVGPVTAPTTIPADQIKNGNVSFTSNPAVLTAPTTVSGADAGCNNNKWTGVNPTLTVTDITMTISQGGALLFTCTASNPNGLSGTVPLSC